MGGSNDVSRGLPRVVIRRVDDGTPGATANSGGPAGYLYAGHQLRRLFKPTHAYHAHFRCNGQQCPHHRYAIADTVLLLLKSNSNIRRESP
ncbi:hypothetical protein AVEN_92084-1 [Araneus ventricosus]|uniref:Uncharacterized protein n=1 Tax=Araneus ventricosus TaxID=182803 RepID=A0A4Y2X9S4_ARAVE|nr:hypothetical protein AVEN_99777-1 [Araneus ventricosus]GBO44927.1 hypothetical protein AVEN_92084-1 [Araneus ventricosus]